MQEFQQFLLKVIFVKNSCPKMFLAGEYLEREYYLRFQIIWFMKHFVTAAFCYTTDQRLSKLVCEL